MFISMNYENSCVYLCFCCVDAVDCCCQNQDLQDYGDLQDWDDVLHRFHPHPSPLPSRERGDWWLVLSCCQPSRFPSGLRIKSAMTWASWPAGAQRGVVPRAVDSRLRGNDGDEVLGMTGGTTLPLWIADQVRNDVGVVASRCSAWRVLTA